MDQEQRIANLEQAMDQMEAHYWRFQGRLNALETIALQAVFDRAYFDPNPFQWVQAYIKSMETMKITLMSDVDDTSTGERLLKETAISLDEFLEILTAKAGGLRGAPAKPSRGDSL